MGRTLPFDGAQRRGFPCPLATRRFRPTSAAPEATAIGIWTAGERKSPGRHSALAGRLRQLWGLFSVMRMLVRLCLRSGELTAMLHWSIPVAMTGSACSAKELVYSSGLSEI